MEPFSAAVGGLTLVQLSVAGVKQVKKVRDLKNAPKVVEDLRAEVNASRNFNEETINAVRGAARQLEIDVPCGLLKDIDQAEEEAVALETFISHDITTGSVKHADGSCKINKRAYLGAQGRIDRLRQRVHKARLDIFASLSSYTLLVFSASSKKVLHAIDDLHATVSHDAASAHSQQSSKSILHSEDATDEKSPTDATSLHMSDTSTLCISEVGKQEPDLVRERTTSTDGSFEPKKLTRRQSGCSPNCGCRCHSYSDLATPDLFTPLFGKLSVNYRASFWRHGTCDRSWCQLKARHTTMTWSLPFWTVSGVLTASYLRFWSEKPSYALKFMNVRNGDWQLHKWLQQDEEGPVIEEAQRQLQSRESSLSDMTSNGSTLLHLALLNDFWVLASQLVERGADIHYKDDFGWSPAMLVWAKHWRNPGPLSELLTYKLPGDSTHFDEFGFSELHKAYLRITKVNLQQRIASSTKDRINAVDAQGRSVLSWAASRGDFETMERLLSRGADPNQTRDDGCTALHLAVQHQGHECTRLLLDWAADPNACNSSDISPMHFAHGAEQVKLLLNNGADPDKLDYKGRTAIHYAILEDLAPKLAVLLDAEAFCGLDEVNLAIQYNNHDCLTLLLSHWTELSPQYSSGDRSTFFYVASCADSKTMGIMASLWPGHLDWMDDERQTAPVLEVAHKRRDANDLWSQEFAKPRDEDALEWYSHFKEMFQRMAESRGVTLPFRCEADNELVEIWEDAKEALA